MPSTRDLTSIPQPDRLRRLLQSLAALDAVLCSDWEYRHHSFRVDWGPNEQIGTWRNGSGDDVLIWFGRAGVFVKGFLHESPMAFMGRVWPGVLDSVPDDFSDCLHEPAFEIEATTFCFWSRADRPLWERGNIEFPNSLDPDGSEGLLRLWDGSPDSYCGWAREYFERDLDVHAVRQVYDGKRMVPELARALNPVADWDDLRLDLDEIGYPT